MEFDLFTFIATIVNFLVIVVLLRIFLYDRIVKAIDEREQKIKDRWERAEAEREEASRKAAEYEQKRQSLEAERQTLLEETQEEAAEKKRQLIEEAREEVESQKEEWMDTLRREQEQFLSDFRTETGRQLVSVLQSILGDLADSSLEEKTVDRFVALISNLDDEEGEHLRSALTGSQAEVHTAHEITDEAKERIRAAVSDLAEDATVEFRTDADLIAGVALITSERRMEWSVRDYLGDIGESLSERVAAV